jgi:muramoyltetrapeptide carboxypeptidase
MATKQRPQANQKKALILPKSLKPGSTIAICTPASPITVPDSWIQDSYSFLRGKGYSVIEGRNVRSVYGHTAGEIKQRVKSLHELFTDPSVSAIMAFWGGLQSHQLLEYLDFDLIREHPKIFVGYSDITALNAALYSQAKLVSFSGPAGISFCSRNRFPYTWDHFERLVSKRAAEFVIKPSPMWADDTWWRYKDRGFRKRRSAGWKVFRPGTAAGPLIGGNLGTLLLLHGTKYWPNLDGALLLVEEDATEKPGSINRLFTRLRHLGIFDQISGLVIGRFCGDVGFSSKDSLEMILKDALKGYNFPVVYDVDFGHTAPMFTFPIGIRGEISSRPLQLRITQPCVTD